MPRRSRRGPPRAAPLGGLSIAEVIRRVGDAVHRHRVVEQAAALSYYFLFALFPTLLFLTAMLGLAPIPGLMGRFMAYVDRVLPGDAASLVSRTLGEVVHGASGGLLSVGAVMALWAASTGMASITAALDAAHGITDRRPWWRRRLAAVLLTLAFSLLTLVALALLVFGGRLETALAAWIGYPPLLTVAWHLARWPLGVACALTGISLAYEAAPAVSRRWRWVSPGALVALTGWVLASFALQLYVRYFGYYNKTYGSIGGVILLMLWFYLSSLMLLVGAHVNVVIDTARAATKAPRPLVPAAPVGAAVVPAGERGEQRHDV